MPQPFWWDATRLRYVNAAGHAIPRGEIRAALDHALRNEKTAIRGLAERLRTGNISLTQWQLQMRERLKNIHVYSAQVARGGRAQMQPSDYGKVGSQIKFQYKKLDAFAREIHQGYPLDGRFLSRVELYSESGRGTFAVHDGRAHSDAGYTHEHSYLGVADHCDECVNEESRGWQPIGTLVPIGNRTCVSRCACSMSYAHGVDGR